MTRKSKKQVVAEEKAATERFGPRLDPPWTAYVIRTKHTRLGHVFHSLTDGLRLVAQHPKRRFNFNVYNDNPKDPHISIRLNHPSKTLEYMLDRFRRDGEIKSWAKSSYDERTKIVAAYEVASRLYIDYLGHMQSATIQENFVDLGHGSMQMMFHGLFNNLWGRTLAQKPPKKDAVSKSNCGEDVYWLHQGAAVVGHDWSHILAHVAVVNRKPEDSTPVATLARLCGPRTPSWSAAKKETNA